jgi:hypothetical protein
MADPISARRTSYPKPHKGATWQLSTRFPLLFANTAPYPFLSLQPSVPINLKVKDCGPKVGLDEISYVPRVGMSMDIRLQMSS